MRLPRASAEGRLDRELAAISKTRLLVIDELGYVPVDGEGSGLLFQVVTNAYERQGVIYTTNIESGGWGRVLGDPNMATAIVDRTVHHGRMIRFEGESYRRTHALMGREPNNNGGGSFRPTGLKPPLFRTGLTRHSGLLQFDKTQFAMRT